MQVLIAWGSSTLVLAFRGTASLKNVLHDLQVHIYTLARQPLHAVHAVTR
jgi:hypothetical protein